MTKKKVETDVRYLFLKFTIYSTFKSLNAVKIKHKYY